MRLSARWFVHERCSMAAMGSMSGGLRVLQVAEFDVLSHCIEVIDNLQHIRFANPRTFNLSYR